MVYLFIYTSMIKSVQIKNLLKSSLILSIPGFVSIFLSIVSIPIHLKIAGMENYGNYLLFHILLSLSLILNLGISKVIVIGSNYKTGSTNKIAYDGIKYSLYVIIAVSLIYLPTKLLIIEYLNILFSIELFFLGLITSILYLTFEGILQANKLFKNISLINFLYYSLSLSLPSILLLFFKELTLNEIISISVIIKVLTILILSIYLMKNKLVIKNSEKNLLRFFMKNSQWLTFNSVLVQIYEIFDKYLIKIFLGTSLMAIYSIPQQLTGKLTILSKSFSTFLLPNLSRNKSEQFIYSLEFFLKYLPIIIFLLFPFYPYILKLWLSDQYSTLIHDLTKIFSLIAIYSCTSHILITKFESDQLSNLNFRIEIIFLPFFFISLIFLCYNSYSLILISVLILLKEIIFIFCRLYLLKPKTNIKILYLNLVIFPILLILSFTNMNLFYLLLVLIIFYTFVNAKFYN